MLSTLTSLSSCFKNNICACLCFSDLNIPTLGLWKEFYLQAWSEVTPESTSDPKAVPV